MSGRSARRLAWVLVALFIGALAAAIYFGFNPEPGGEPIVLLDAVWAVSFIGFPVTGALIVGILPARLLGWLLCIGPLLLAIGLALLEAAEALTIPAFAEAWLVWAANVAFSSGFMMLSFVPLLLPDGRLPSPRWRIPAYVMLAITVLSAATIMFSPGPFQGSDIMNPLGLDSLAPLLELLTAVTAPLSLALFPVAAASAIFRFRASSGQERQQLKWLALGALVVLVSTLAIAAVEVALGDKAYVAATVLTVVAVLAFPTAIAIAVTRYRLYDIDVIINRTVVYGAVTATLAAAYFVLVVAFQALLSPLTEESDLAVAASTLAVAALFGPLRSRIQSFIDRRFYRSRYDTQRTLESFSGRLRDEVDLVHLASELVEVVSTTMQPRHASLWLRPTRRTGGS